MNGPYRVLVVDDHRSVREAYSRLLAGSDEFEVVATARDGRDGIAAFETLQPDLVLMDLQLPRISGVEATREICERWPGACVVVLTTFATNDLIVSALRAGAAGYLLKDAAGKSLTVSMHQALAGEMPLSASVRRQLVATLVAEAEGPPAEPPQPGLTDRESELLRWLAKGLTNQQIGSKMYVSEGSVKQYLSRIGAKVGAKSRTQILVRAIQLNLIDPRDDEQP